MTKLSSLQTGLYLTVCVHILWNKCTFKLYWNHILQCLFIIFGTSVLQLVHLEPTVVLLVVCCILDCCHGLCLFRKHRFVSKNGSAAQFILLLSSFVYICSCMYVCM